MACTPCARSAGTAARTSASFSGTRTWPRASSRSRIPTRRRRGARNVGTSESISRSYIRERFIRPSSSTSSKPSVVRMAVTAPCCSRMALVAMVVPWMKRSTSPALPPARASTLVTAAPMPSSRSFGVLGTFVSARRPARSRATMSVKVPPMSTPICSAVLLGRGSGYHTAVRDLLDRLDGWRDEQIEFLARLVNHDSGTDDGLAVNRVGAILAERLERLGFNLRRVVNDRFGDHLVGDKPGRGPKRFLFVGHYDTVFPSGTAKQRPFRIDPEGRAWGPGVYDMKGGLAALLYPLRAHADAHTRTWAETGVSVVFNADEERLSPTSREVIGAEARRAHSVGILEPARPGGEYVMARKGAGTFYLEVTGKASHAGLQPELGASAIWDLAQKVAALHALTDLEQGTTINVGTVRGGERPNVVANRAFAEIDLRAGSQREADAAIATMRQIGEPARVPGTAARFWGEVNFPPWPPGLPGTERLLEIMRAAGRDLGVDVRAIKTGGGSDGNHTSAIAPTLDGLGPKGRRAHSEEEFIEVATLLERTKMLALFLDRWAAEFEIAPRPGS